MRLSYSKIDCWKSCRKQFEWSYDVGLKPKLVKPAADVGRSIHVAMSEFYQEPPQSRSGTVLTSTFEKHMQLIYVDLEQYMGGLDTKDKEDFTKSVTKGKVMLEAYWNKYGTDPEIPQCETEKKVEIDLGEGLIFVSKLDGLMTLPATLFQDAWCLEHKTGNADIQSLELEDEQGLFYVWAMRKLDLDCRGVIYNVIGNPTYGTKVNLEREKVDRTSNEIKDIEVTIRQIAWEIKNLPRYANRGAQCRWCDFRELCRAQSHGGDSDYLANMHFEIYREENK